MLATKIPKRIMELQLFYTEMDEGVLDHLKEFLMRVYSISLQRINKFVQFHLPKSSTASLDIQ